MNEFNPIKEFRRHWIDEDTKIQYNARIAIDLSDVSNIEEYVLEEIDCENPLVMIRTYNGTMCVEGDFDLILKDVRLAAEFTYLNKISLNKN